MTELLPKKPKNRSTLGNLYREGELLAREEIAVFDHDFSHLAEGVAIPHAIYDLQNNSAYVNIGTSKETNEFAYDSMRRWWYNRGRYDYPGATSMLVLVDSGSSNSYRHYIFLGRTPEAFGSNRPGDSRRSLSTLCLKMESGRASVVPPCDSIFK